MEEQENSPKTTPVLPKNDSGGPVLMNFPIAIEKIIDGKRITKLEWGNDNYFGELKDGKLMLHKADGKYYQWIINDGDLFGADWVELPDAN